MGFRDILWIVIIVTIIFVLVIIGLNVLMMFLNSRRLKKEVIPDEVWSGIMHKGLIPVPWHKYVITQDKILEKSGLFVMREKETFLYLVVDITETENIFQRMINTGNIIVSTRDENEKELILRGIKDPLVVKNILSNAVRRERKTRPEVVVR